MLDHRQIKATSCTVEYRKHVPWDTIAFVFCDIDFTGNDCELFEKEYKKFLKNDSYYNYCKDRYENDIKKVKKLEEKLNELNSSKNPYKWWGKTYKWRMWRKQHKIDIENTRKSFYELKNKVYSLEHKSYVVSAEVDCIKDFLKMNGFVRIFKNEYDAYRDTETWIKYYE